MNVLRKIFTLVVLSQAFFVYAGDVPDQIFIDSFEFCTTGDADVIWDGGGDGTSWLDPLNWSGNSVPVNGQTVVINVVTDVNIVYNDPITPVQPLRINNLDSCNSISVTRGTLELDGFARVRRRVSISGNATLTVLNNLRTFLLEQSGGTMNGAGTVSVDGRFTWTGGNQEGPGETIAEDGMTLSGNALRHLNARTLTLNGDSLWDSTTTGAMLRFQHAGVINNNGPFAIQTDADMQDSTGDPGILNNSSTITKTIATGLTEIQATLNNSGTITSPSGTINIDGVIF